jgi:small-conductance mechanosensitive channel
VIESITQTLQSLLTPAGLRQLAVFAGCVALAFILVQPMRRWARRSWPARVRSPWLRRMLQLGNRAIVPLLVSLLSGLAGLFFAVLDWDSTVFEWLRTLANYWVFYAIAAAFFDINYLPEQARVWKRYLLIPLGAIVLVLDWFGLLDDVLLWAPLPDQLPEFTLGTLIVAVIATVIGLSLARGLREFLQERFLPDSGLDPTKGRVVAVTTYYALVGVVFLIALSAIGIDLTTLTVILGGLSVGIGLGLQEIIKNFVAGLVLIFERSVSPGDLVQIGTDTGTVKEVGVRAMTIGRGVDNVDMVVPNARFMTDTLFNFSRDAKGVRIRITVGVSYDAEPRQAAETLLAAAQHPKLLADPAPAVVFSGFGDSTLNFDLFAWVADPGDQWAVASDLRFQVWDALRAAGIEIAYPQRDIHVRSWTTGS